PPWSTRDDIRGSLLRARADLPGGLAEAIAHALAVDPEARPSAADLVQVLEGAGGAVGTDRSSAPLAGPAARHRLRWGLGAAILVAAAAVAVLSPPGIRDATTEATLGPFAVAEFRNETGDSTLDFIGRMAGDWVTQGLQQVGTASVVPWPMALAAS